MNFPLTRNVIELNARDGQRVLVNTIKQGPALIGVQLVVRGAADAKGAQVEAGAEITGQEAAQLLSALSLALAGT